MKLSVHNPLHIFQLCYFFCYTLSCESRPPEGYDIAFGNYCIIQLLMLSGL